MPKTIKAGPLGPKNYPPVIPDPEQDDLLVRFIDEHLFEEASTWAEIIVENARLWYVLTMIKEDKSHVTIRVPL